MLELPCGSQRHIWVFHISFCVTTGRAWRSLNRPREFRKIPLELGRPPGAPIYNCVLRRWITCSVLVKMRQKIIGEYGTEGFGQLDDGWDHPKRGAGFAFGMNSVFDPWRMVCQRKIVMEMSVRSLLCDMTFAEIYGLNVRITDRHMGHDGFMLERHIGYMRICSCPRQRQQWRETRSLCPWRKGMPNDQGGKCRKQLILQSPGLPLICFDLLPWDSGQASLIWGDMRPSSGVSDSRHMTAHRWLLHISHSIFVQFMQNERA